MKSLKEKKKIKIVNMKKIIFFTVLLSIIFYGFLSNYSKKKKIKDYFQDNKATNLL